MQRRYIARQAASRANRWYVWDDKTKRIVGRMGMSAQEARRAAERADYGDDTPHNKRREFDEYVCTCGTRWSTQEGDTCPQSMKGKV